MSRAGNKHVEISSRATAARRPPPPPPPPPRRGIALVIMLLALILLGGFLVVSARLFVTVMRTSESAGRAERDIAEFESAIRVLRADVWGATSVAPDAAGTTLALQSSNGAAVRWHTADDDALVRTIIPAANGDTSVQRWPQLGGRLRFAVAGPTVTGTLADATSTSGAGGGGDGGAGLQLVSQVLLAREMSR